VKILIIRLSSIGDIVLTTPVIRCLKQQLPNAEIHFLTKASFASILISNPYLSKIHPLKEDIAFTIGELKEENFELIIDLQKNFRSRHIRSFLKVKAYSFPKLNFKKWLLVNFKINRLPKIHIVDRYFMAVKKPGIINDKKGLDYFIPENEEVDLKNLPLPHQKKYIAFVIGTTYFTKRLPTEKIISICKQINDPVILLGGIDDAGRGEKVAKEVGENIYNACGKYSLHQSASIVKNAFKVITHDTGLMHIAAAFDKDIISVWGNTIPAFGMTPYMRSDKRFVAIEVENLSCRPCTKLGYKKCPKKHFKCMQLIDEEKIIRALQ
jgi:ADP-heptose:LPS heptosyltransferase